MIKTLKKLLVIIMIIQIVEMINGSDEYYKTYEDEYGKLICR